jgi:hypothetical protein
VPAYANADAHVDPLEYPNEHEDCHGHPDWNLYGHLNPDENADLDYAADQHRYANKNVYTNKHPGSADRYTDDHPDSVADQHGWAVCARC